MAEFETVRQIFSKALYIWQCASQFVEERHKEEGEGGLPDNNPPLDYSLIWGYNQLRDLAAHEQRFGYDQPSSYPQQSNPPKVEQTGP